MRKKDIWAYLFLIIVAVVFFNIPLSFADRLRAKIVPLILTIDRLVHRQNSPVASPQETLAQLERENHILKHQIDKVREWLVAEERIEQQLLQIEKCNFFSSLDKDLSDYFKRRSIHLAELLYYELLSLPAEVIFREPLSWGTSLWIDRGEADNRVLGYRIIAEDSPVVVGNSVIGVVEHVGETKSRVRLITDHNLTPAVRVVRGTEQNRMLLEHVSLLYDHLRLRRDTVQEDHPRLFEELALLEGSLRREVGDKYLAKGLLQGRSAPLWRFGETLLHGIGFNYDHGDAEGPSRDLHVGSALFSSDSEDILQQGDVLVTSGMDGVFPPGLYVATVAKIYPLKEGGYAYDIEAKPTAGNLTDLQFVQVLPPRQEEGHHPR